MFAGFLLGFKGKLVALLLVSGLVFSGGWLVRGWYEGNIQKIALEQQRRAFQKEIDRVTEQHRKDAAAAQQAAQRLQSLRRKYHALQRGVQRVEVSDQCRVVDAAALERLWNDARPAPADSGSAD